MIVLTTTVVGVAMHDRDCPAAEPDADWWMTPHRMIQTNLREIDARV